MASFKITKDNTEKIINLKDAAVAVALEAIGLQAEKYANGLLPNH